jgi:hypothetical protein
MTRIQSICFVLVLAVAPVLSAMGTVEPAKPKLTGGWKGSWDTGSYSGTFSMHLTQKGKKFSGTVAITIDSRTTKGTVKGTIRKNKLTVVVSTKQLGTGKGTGEVNKARTTMSGTVTIHGSKSTFNGSKT